MFKTNENLTDRMMRITIGVLLISFVFLGSKTPWGWLGLAPLVSGLIGWCPIYAVLRIDTSTWRTI